MAMSNHAKSGRVQGWRKAIFFLAVAQIFVIIAVFVRRMMPLTLTDLDTKFYGSDSYRPFSWQEEAINKKPGNYGNYPSNPWTRGAGYPDLGLAFKQVRVRKSNRNSQSGPYKISVAIGLGISTRKMKVRKRDWATAQMQFFQTLLPSFCRTASEGYNYHFFVAYDHNDKFLSTDWFPEVMESRFLNMTSSRCPRQALYAIHLVRCAHHGRPAWAQGDAMTQAYLEGMDYFYRVNDDTQMESKGWLPIFINALESFSPPRVGVVGPKHSGGYTEILTYDFVHRTHLEVFGFYYPRCYTDWYADGWISGVYLPGRVSKLDEVTLKHTQTTGTRYDIHLVETADRERRVALDRKTVARFVTAMETKSHRTGTRKIIAMALSGADTVSHWGVVRNAQLRPVIYPDWAMRVYITSQPHLAVPTNILKTLQRLNVQIHFVNESAAPPGLWHYLVADDMNVDYFLLRNPQSRFTEREAAAVQDWLRSNTTVHTMVDHPIFTPQPIPAGLWGADAKGLRSFLRVSMETLFRDIRDVYSPTNKTIEIEKWFLSKYVWPHVKSGLLYHDGLQCDAKDNRRPFPTARNDWEFVGMNYTNYEEAVLTQYDMESGVLKASCAEMD